MDNPAAQPGPRRGWRRGLIMAGLALMLAWVFRERERAAAGSSTAAPTPGRAKAVGPLPTDAVLATPAQARPRLLALLPEPSGKPDDGLESRLRQVCGERLALALGDEHVAAALNVEGLPAFVLYSASGQEEVRLCGPDALTRLAAELRSRGLPAEGLGEGAAP